MPNLDMENNVGPFFDCTSGSARASCRMYAKPYPQETTIESMADELDLDWNTNGDDTVSVQRLFDLKPTSRKRKKSRRPRWTQTEEIFLAGIVMETYRRNHSLKPARNDSASTLDGNDSIWDEILKRYRIALSRHSLLTGEHLPNRTVSALKKRWKNTNKRRETKVDGDGCFLVQTSQTKIYEAAWDSDYNRGGRYSCPEKEFREKYFQKGLRTTS